MSRKQKSLAQFLQRYLPRVAAGLARIGLRTFESPVQLQVRGEGNYIDWSGANLENITIRVEGNHNQVRIGVGAALTRVRIHLRGDHHQLLIGPACKMKKGGNILIEDRDCQLHIGEGSTFEGVSLAVLEPGSRLMIGTDCMFSYDIDVRTSDSHSVIEASTGNRINPAADICIGDHVWLGAHVIVLKGAVIPDHSVVAAGSVVTRQFDECGIVLAGNPARQVKSGVSWLRKRI